jgi:hypothetical protein
MARAVAIKAAHPFSHRRGAAYSSLVDEGSARVWLVHIVVWLVKCLLWIEPIFVARWICEMVYLAIWRSGSENKLRSRVRCLAVF